MMQRGQRAALFPRQFSYPLSFRGQVCGTQSSLPCFSSMALDARRRPFLHRVPASPVPRLHRYYDAATTSRRACLSAYGFAFRFRMALELRVRLSRSRRRQVGRRARKPCSAGASNQPARSCGRGRDLSGFLAAHPAPLPCSKTPAEPTYPDHNGFVDAAPGPNKAKASAVHDFEAAAGLQRALSTLHERRCRRPCKTRFRPAGSAFTGRELIPRGRDERFQLTTYIPPFQDLS